MGHLCDVQGVGTAAVSAPALKIEACGCFVGSPFSSRFQCPKTGEWHEGEPNPRAARIAFLERKLAGTRADLLLKYEDNDYHGVADAAMDCRDIVSELAGLRLE